VDGAGLVKVATFVREAVTYMGDRDEPLTVTIAQTFITGGEPATASNDSQLARVLGHPQVIGPGETVSATLVCRGK
jgi:hypothetical protein